MLKLSLGGLKRVKWTRGWQLKERTERGMGWALFKGMLADSMWLIFSTVSETLFLQQPYMVMPLLQMRDLRRQEMKWFAQVIYITTQRLHSLVSNLGEGNEYSRPIPCSEQKEIFWHLNWPALLKHCISSWEPDKTQTWNYISTTTAPHPGALTRQGILFLRGKEMLINKTAKAS